MPTLEERIATANWKRAYARKHIALWQRYEQEAALEREVLLEEQQARDEIEYASVRGISAPDF